MSKKFQFLAGSITLENKPLSLSVASAVTKALSDCEGYIAYKLTTLGRARDEDVPTFIVISKEHGIILLDVIEDRLTDIQEGDNADFWFYHDGSQSESRSLAVQLYEEEVVSRLKNNSSFYDRRKRKCKVPVKSAVVFCNNSDQELEQWHDYFDLYDSEIITNSELSEFLQALPKDYNCSDDELASIYSLIEGTFIYEKKQNKLQEQPLTTYNDFIQESLNITFKQDDAQRFASMQLPPGPQRIRGLAGTGKTIVLSIKAALTHKRFDNFKILYLFNTQSLYQNVQQLISKYYTLEAKKAPDFENGIHVFHAWGGKQKPGLYSSLCHEYGITPLTMRQTAGDGIAYIYADLMKKLKGGIKEKYDLILIDEAQDFPKELFEVIFKLAKGDTAEKKRIIWAYDEFQSLRDTQIKGPEDLFGLNDQGQPNMPNHILEGEYSGEIPKDFVLPNCYRTPRPVLMTAHGAALGLYTPKPNEMFYQAKEWEALGYKVIRPVKHTLEEGDKVEIERPAENSKNLLEKILENHQKNPLSLVQHKQLDTLEEEFEFIADRAYKLIQFERVPPEEIIMINLGKGSNKYDMLALQRKLSYRGINSVIPGYVESADVFKPEGYVTITTPFRAKGNEANIVFVFNSQYVVSDLTLRNRNSFFVSITRSRGWCFITGNGEKMTTLQNEIKNIIGDFPKFKFICPNPTQVKAQKSFLNRSDVELDKIDSMFKLMEDEGLRELMEEYLATKKRD